MSQNKVVNSTSSEELTLHIKGYKILRQLGEGSYAKVYLADYKRPSNQARQHMLACKIIDLRKAPASYIHKFLPREMDILVRLSHPHIIHVHSIFRRKTKYFVFMRYAEQGDLLDYVAKFGPISEAQARVWFRQMCLAVQYLHDQGIVHRDLKCENILLTNNFNAKITDFSFSRYVIDDKGKFLQSDTHCGSVSYASPEILHGRLYTPMPSDIWSLGVVLYVMLNKAMPFSETNARRAYEQQIGKRWKFQSNVVNTLSKSVKKLIPMMMEPNAKKRYKIEQVLASEWIAMDPRNLSLTDEEKTAKLNAIQRKQRKSGLKQRVEEDNDQGSNTEIKVLKKASKTVFKESHAMKPNMI